MEAVVEDAAVPKAGFAYLTPLQLARRQEDFEDTKRKEERFELLARLLSLNWTTENEEEKWKTLSSLALLETRISRIGCFRKDWAKSWLIASSSRLGAQLTKWIRLYAYWSLKCKIARRLMTAICACLSVFSNSGLVLVWFGYVERKTLGHRE